MHHIPTSYKTIIEDTIFSTIYAYGSKLLSATTKVRPQYNDFKTFHKCNSTATAVAFSYI
jgi:hypothetical protein